MQIIIQNESIGYPLHAVINVSEERAERWIKKGFARSAEEPAAVEDTPEDVVDQEPADEKAEDKPAETKKAAKKSAKKRAK